MYFFPSELYQDFQMACQLIRFDYPYVEEKREPHLLIQINTLELKYIIQNSKIDLIFTKIDNKLLYILRLWDNETEPLFVWSILENDDETAALMKLVTGKNLTIVLFNELTVPIAWKEIYFAESFELFKLINSCTKGKIHQDDFQEKANDIIENIIHNKTEKCLIFKIDNSSEWNYPKSSYITNQCGSISLNICKDIEGAHQEQIALWLIDNLVPDGAYHSPQIPNGNSYREFTDLLLTYENGCFLFESKSLSILSREKIPNREQLIKDNNKHIEKAIKQLKGALRHLRNGGKILANQGNEILINRKNPAHCIIVISDMSLTPDINLIGIDTINDFVNYTHSYIHLVDLNELKRIVQAATMLVKNGKNISLIQAFDFYLRERFKIAIKKGNLNIEVLLHIH